MDCIEQEKLAKEAYEKIERKFTSGNDTDVERITITREEWDFAKGHLAIEEYKKNLKWFHKSD